MLDAIYKLHDSKNDHPMVAFVEAIITAAFQRKESRGGHFRSDFKQTNDVALHSCIKYGRELTFHSNLPSLSMII